MNYDDDEKFSSFEEICKDAHELSMTAVTVTFSSVTDTFVPDLDRCMGLESFNMICDDRTKAINLTFINVLRNLTSLWIDWKVTPESINRDRALALCENQSDLITKLKTVNLFTNNFIRIGPRHFSCLQELEELYWTDSEIEHIEDFTFNSTSLLKTLDLSRNKISHLTNYTFFGLPNLKTLLLEENKLLMIETWTLLPLTSVEFVNLGVFQYSSSEPSKIQINLSLPENLTKLSISSGIRPMTLILSKSKKSQVGLSLNSGLDVIFHNLSNLEYLFMSFCFVPLFEKDLSRDLKSLKVMFLQAGGVFSVMENFVEPLKNLRYLILKDTHLHCSCDNAWITNWAKYEKNVQVSFRDSTLERLPCKTADNSTFLQKFAQENCSFNVDFFLFVSTSLGLVFFMLVVLLHQLFGDYLLAFFHIARAWVEEAMRGNRKGHYHFDVFVSYSGKDECWVMDELLPNLEKRGPPSLKLCLHSRDFELGKDIVENITDSLYRSRHTLCLVSRNYLRSTWCSLEMRLATYRLLAEHRDVLVLVFLEKVSHQLLNVHHRLSRLVKTRTYMDWPHDPALHNAFWDRLWRKLAPESAT
ncbi:toll-like receptor 13 [Clarias gariepinus]|uniref:toll-like receptor 13 n=1 Tax=Clarias gariepinus TaxID=13013 RepID=UPI00234DF209|nr:toll-like receptor 13 [Clarias gariepinus]